MNGQNTNGWFIGFIEHGENTYCFATNLQNSENATGSAASEITIEILNSLFSLKMKILYSQKLKRLMPINTSVYQDNQSLKVSAYIVNVGL